MEVKGNSNRRKARELDSPIDELRESQRRVDEDGIIE